jgi:choline-sulfatase
LKLRAAAFAVLLLSGSVSWSAGGPQSRAGGGPSVIVISIDTLRSDHLPAYGYRGVETPAIDRLRRDGILFARAYTNVPLTLPAHTALLTGVLPPENGVRDNLGYTVDPAKSPLLQQTLKNAGWATGAAVSAYVLRESTGIAHGFDFYDDDVGFHAGPGIQSLQRSGRDTLAAAEPWLREAAGGPFFLFFHIFEPHSPYDPPAEFAGRFASPYDGEIAAADAVVGALLDELRELGVYDTALIVLLSDHGEGLGDHGEDEHGLFVYRSTLQVPLIVKLPGKARAGTTVERPVQLIDVYPTVLAVLGLTNPPSLQGGSLLETAERNPQDSAVYAETFFPRLHFGWSELRSLIAGRYHYIDAPTPELYDLVADPEEGENLASSKPELAGQLRNGLSVYDRSLEAPTQVDAETRRRLQALGYVGEVSTDDSGTLPDPKTRAGVLAEIRSGYLLYSAGDFASAATAFAKIIKENPKVEDAWDYLALAQLGLGQPEKAIATYREALEQLPGASRLSLRLALLLYRAGRLDEAFIQANLAIPYDPAAAHILLAQIAFHKGDLEDAEHEAREAVSNDPGRPGSYLVLADVDVARGEPLDAVQELTQALDDGVTDESVRAKLAATYLWMGQVAEAEGALAGLETTDNLDTLMAFGRLAEARQQWGEARSWFERALEVDPHNPYAEIRLGVAVLADGDAAEAKRLLEDGLSRAPGSFEGWNTLGVASARLGDADGAVAAWEHARELDPQAVGLLFNLGLAYAQAGKLEQAIQSLEEFVARAPDGPQRQRAQEIASRLRQRASQNR